MKLKQLRVGGAVAEWRFMRFPHARILSSFAFAALVACSAPTPEGCRLNTDCATGEVCTNAVCVKQSGAGGGSAAVGGGEGGGGEADDAGAGGGATEIPCTPNLPCRPADGGCDAEETCDSTGHCPIDAVQPLDTTCRAAAGGCDLIEKCDGVSARCPEDTFAPAATSCAVASCSMGLATPQAFCAGGSATCPDGTAISCNGYQCNGVGCATTCTSDASCLPTHFCQVGAQCAPKKPDGAACVSGFECLAGICTPTFIDNDHDGYGTGASAKTCGMGAQPGRAIVGGDCCDTDARAHPTQNTFFTTASMCGTFDFDCDMASTREDTRTNACQSVGSCSGGDSDCSEGTGWSGATVPGCGSSGLEVTSCSTRTVCNQATCPGCLACTAVTRTKVQGCK